MTERKPAHKSFRSWVDDQIVEAQRRGEFDDLPGKGKPISGLDQPYDALWWVKQLMVREELEYLPPALALRRDAERVLDHIVELASERAVREVVEELNVRIRDANRKPALDGPPSMLMPLDVDVVVARWRNGRDASDEVATAVPGRPPASATPTPGEKRDRRRWWPRRRLAS